MSDLDEKMKRVREGLDRINYLMAQIKNKKNKKLPTEEQMDSDELPNNVIRVEEWGLNPKPHKFYTDGSPKLNTMEVDRRANNEKIIRGLKKTRNNEEA